MNDYNCEIFFVIHSHMFLIFRGRPAQSSKRYCEFRDYNW